MSITKVQESKEAEDFAKAEAVRKARENRVAVRLQAWARCQLALRHYRLVRRAISSIQRWYRYVTRLHQARVARAAKIAEMRAAIQAELDAEVAAELAVLRNAAAVTITRAFKWNRERVAWERTAPMRAAAHELLAQWR